MQLLSNVLLMVCVLNKILDLLTLCQRIANYWCLAGALRCLVMLGGVRERLAVFCVCHAEAFRFLIVSGNYLLLLGGPLFVIVHWLCLANIDGIPKWKRTFTQV